MSDKGAGRARLVSEPSPHPVHEARKASARIYPERLTNASGLDVSSSTPRALSTGDRVFPVNRQRARIRPGGFIVYAVFWLSALYIAGHVAVALVGWRGLALIACAVVYLTGMAWSWSTSRTWSRRIP